MKKPAYIRTILYSEAKCFFHNRRQVLAAFLPGPLVVLLLMFLISHITAIPSRIDVFGGEEYRNFIQTTINSPDIISFTENRAIGPDVLSRQKNYAAIQVGADEICIQYNSSLISDPGLISKAKDIARCIAVIRESPDRLEEYSDTLSAYRLTDLSTYEDQIDSVLIPFLSLFFILFFMLANNTVGSLSIDTITGDKERGTFDMLVLSGAGIFSILAGKYLFIALLSLLILIFGAAVVLAGLSFIQPVLYAVLFSGTQSFPAICLPFFACLFSIALFTPALFIALASFFSKTRQASTYTGIVQIVLSLFTYAPIALNSSVLGYLPVSNLWSVLKNALLGKPVFSCVVSSAAISAFVAVTALFIAKKNVEREMNQ